MAKSGSLKPSGDDANNNKTTKKKPPEKQPVVSPQCNKPYQTKEDTLCVANTPVKITTPVSILIESLVKNLCMAYEKDHKKATVVYNLICDKLFQMKLIDESYTMEEFEGMRSQYQKAFYQVFSAAMGSDSAVPLGPVRPNCEIISSHYHDEFDELEYIAGGGFGQVYRVKHKLDGTEYAVKKIPIRSEGIESVKNYLSEVKTFASLNHPNVVQYKAAWLEIGAPKVDKAITENLSDSFFTSDSSDQDNKPNKRQKPDNDYIYPSVEDAFSLRKVDNTSDFEVDFESGSFVPERQYSYSNNNIVGVERKTRRQKRNSISEGGNAICTIDIHEMQHLHTVAQTKWATLYIQMALCQTTLKQWLEKRNMAGRDVCVHQKETALMPVSGKVREDTVMEILRQLVRGLEYIHSKGIVHHDIKPSNIFIQLENGSLLVQLGDFGLACPLQSVRHTLALGTKLYAAPEQLAGKCDRKSDMYSVGIVLLELVETFRTDMERVHNITELRKGHIPTHILLQHPQFARIIGQLLSRNPQDRPDATTLLKHITIHDKGSKHIKELEMQLAEKDEEIQRLKELLKNAGVKSI